MIFDEPIKVNPKGPYELPDQMHDFLFYDIVKDAHDVGVRLDLHLPGARYDRTKVDAVLTQFLVKKFVEYQTGPMPGTTMKGDGSKWMLISAVQKAVRRGRLDLAMLSAWPMERSDKKANRNHLWRRLAVISMEDVGLGDPYGAAIVCLLASSVKLRESLGRERCLHYALTLLCNAPKSRDMCDIVVYAFHCNGFASENIELDSMPHDRWPELCADQDQTMGIRLVSFWKCYGPKFQTTDIQQHEVPIWFRKEARKNMELPPLIAYLTDKPFRCTGEALSIPIPVVWQMMCASDKVWTDADPWETKEEDVLIKGDKLLAATFDKHVMQGKQSFKYFLNSRPDLAKFMEDHCSGKPVDALERAIFYTDGAILRPRLGFDGSDPLFYEILDAKLVANGWADPDLGLQFFNMVYDALPDLEKARRAVMGE